MAFINNIFELIEKGGYPFLFLLAFIEGNPFVGSFIPGQIILIFVGALISSYGLFSLKTTILIVFLGAFLGDLFGYYLGRKYGVKSLDAVGICHSSTIYQSSYRFFEKYGSWSIFIGREFNITRSFMPFFAGSFRMNIFRFTIIAFISCLFWAAFSVYLGYYFGFILVDNFNFILEFIIFVLIYFLIIYLVYNGLNKYFAENHFYLREYALHNFLFLGFLSSIFVILYFIFKWDFFLIFNDYFSFMFFVVLYSYFGFLLSTSFLFLMYLLIIFVLLYKELYKMVVVYLWSIGFVSIFFILMNIFLKKSLNIQINFTIIVFTLFVFYLWVILEVLITNKKYYKYLNVSLVLFLVLGIITLFSYTGNFFIVILSFIIGVIACELIWIFSYYQILDRCLYECKTH